MTDNNTLQVGCQAANVILYVLIMMGENFFGITGVSREERFIQGRENRIRLLAENGDILIKICQEVGGRGSFFVAAWPEVRQEEASFPQEYDNLMFTEDYRVGFPWVEAGLVLKNPINQMTIILGRLPAISRTIGRSDIKIVADYPLVLVSPNREVLAQIWDRTHKEQFYKVFNSRAYGGQYEQATIVSTEEQMDLLAQCLIEMAGRTLPRSDANAEEYDIRYKFKPTVFQDLSREQFQLLIDKAKELG